MTLSPRPAIIALTTFADPDEEQALREAGAAGYLPKEVHPEKLMKAIRLIVARERPAPDGSVTQGQVALNPTGYACKALSQVRRMSP